MNKTLQEIINQILDLKNENPDLQSLNTSSKTSFWKKIFDTVAFVIWNFQEACKLHLKEIETMIQEQKVPTLRWYRNQALRFQYGFSLLPESDQFSPQYENEDGEMVDATLEDIEKSKVIKYVAVTKAATTSKISMKISTEENDEIVPVSDDVGQAFRAYIEEIQAAGDNITIVNYRPDILRLRFKVCYNPGVLFGDGRSIRTMRYPVQDAIKRFLKNLPFNGELSVQKLEAAILAVEGVTDLLNIEVSTKWIEAGSTGYGQFQPIEISRIPSSGSFTLRQSSDPNAPEYQEDWSGITYINYQAQ
ncbi:nucleotidyltransferase [Chryseobacterium sp.]|uniref:nucleotidyltransferase n=1 Tax=Chryseobacterium sp. TaxID=1871047 RepID=UPI00289BD796|nr:nucleotidyltransferase [Chryseobacterium sp.]